MLKRYTQHEHLYFDNIYDYNDRKTNHQELEFSKADLIDPALAKNVYRGTLHIYYHRSAKSRRNSPQCEDINVAIKLVKGVNAVADMNNEPEMVHYLSNIPGIIKQFAFHIDRQHDRCIMVFEWCGGGDLFSYISNRIVPRYEPFGYNSIPQHVDMCKSNIKKTITWLLNVIKKCHDHGVVYCDLKLENIMLAVKNDFDSLRLIDFGAARYIQENGRDINYDILCTSIKYTAPEVIHHFHQRIDSLPYLEKYKLCGTNLFKIDVWAIGTIAYIMFRGEFPFAINKLYEPYEANSAFSIGTNKEAPIRMYNMPERAADFISHTLCINPNKRYTIDEALDHPWIRSE